MIAPTTKAERLLARFLLDAVVTGRRDELIQQALTLFDLDNETDDGILAYLRTATSSPA